MSDAAETTCNLDTSILMNYVLSNLSGDIEDDRGSQRIIDEDSFYTVIGGKAEGEFSALCDRRYDLYNDAVEFLLTTDDEIFEYDPASRELHTSSNDEQHFRENIQFNWYNKTKREQLDTLRRCFQELELYQIRLPNDLIDRRFPQQSNQELLQRFEAELQVGHDCQILVDAVELSHQHSFNLLVAVDSDITGAEQVRAITAILEDVFGDGTLLQIEEPGNVS